MFVQSAHTDPKEDSRLRYNHKPAWPPRSKARLVRMVLFPEGQNDILEQRATRALINAQGLFLSPKRFYKSFTFYSAQHSTLVLRCNQ